MNLVTERDALANALSRVTGIVDRRQTIQILGHVMLTAVDGSLMIRANNLDMEAVETIPAALDAAGSTTVSADDLDKIVRTFATGAQVTLRLEDGRLHVASGRRRANFGALNPKDFPKLWAEDWPTTFELDAEKLSVMLQSVAYAQCAGPGDAYLQGVFFENREGRLRLVATNRHVISCRDGEESDLALGVTVPAKMIGEMARLLGTVKGMATVGISESKVMLRCGDVAIMSKLIDKSLAYPEYMRAVPSGLPRRVSIPVAALSASISAATIASQGTGSSGKDSTVKLTFRSGLVVVTSRNAAADYYDEIEVEYEGDDPITVALNPTYMLSILASLNADMADVEFEDWNRAMNWRAAGDDAGFVTIMPQLVS